MALSRASRLTIAFFAMMLPAALIAAPIQVLRGHVPGAIAESRRMGPLSSVAPLSLAVGLPLRNREELAYFVDQVSDPASPNYKRYLSTADFTARFGPTQTDYDKLTAFFLAHGFVISGTHPNRMILDVTGPVSAIEKTLHLGMALWEHQTRGRYFAPDREPSLDIDIPVLDITGLDNYVLPKPMNLTAVPLSSAAPMVTGSGPYSLFIGKDFRAAYTPAVTLTGIGQNVGLFELDGFYAADVAANFAQAGLPAVPVQTVLLDGVTGAPGTDNDEVTLDIMMAAYMAPGARVIVYEGLNWNDVLNRMATDNTARQLSCSWVFSPVTATTEQIFLQMIAQGQSFLQASGDNGAYFGWVRPPSDEPNVTVVGGTALTTSAPGGPWLSETTWSGSGGGVSTTYPIPSYQKNMNMAGLGGSSTMRNIPDVAMLAAPQIFLVCNNGQSVEVGGTSAAAPLWAGFIALANQQAVNNRQPALGFLNPALYALGNGSGYAAGFHDITTGSNGLPALAGFDLATGWGTPNGQVLINDLSVPHVPSFTLSAPASLSLQSGGSTLATVQITGHNGFAGAVTLTVKGLPAGVSGTFGAPVNGASQLTLIASSHVVTGWYSITVQGVSGTLSTGVGMILQLTAGPCFSLTSIPPAVSVIQGGSSAANLTVASVNGFTGAVSLTVAGLPAGVTASFSPASTATVSTLRFSASNSAAAGATTVTVTGKSGSLTATLPIALTVVQPAAFTVAVSPSTITMLEGATATSAITVTPKTGFTGKVTLSASGLPAGVTASFSPLTSFGASVVTLIASRSAATGRANVLVTGSFGASSASAALAVTVQAAPSFTLAAAPASLNVVQGNFGSSTVSVTPINGFTGVVALTVAGLPAGVTGSFSPASASATAASKLTLTAAPTAATGTATLTITGVSGGVSATTTVFLTIKAAPGVTLSSSASNVKLAAGATGSAMITVVRVGGFSHF